jgi:thiol-disulfide isomerase/thioredoxin
MTIPTLILALTVSATLIVVLRSSSGRHIRGGFPAVTTLATAFAAEAAVVGIAAATAGFATTIAYAADKPAASPAQLSLINAPQWLNTAPLRATDLRGKVVLVNFWTYSCINSLRVLPYVRAWADKYKDRGLVTVGLHTPEFGFEKDIANVRRATSLY